MNRVSEIIQKRRKELGIELKDVSSITKISQEQLQKIEESHWDYFDSNVYLEGVVNKYADYLKLDKEKVALYLKREIKLKNPKFIRTTDYEKNHKSLFTNWSVILLILSILSFFGLQWYLSWQKPLLKINKFSPLIKTNQQLTIKGKTEPGVILYLNNELIYQNQEGFFSESLFFKNPGERQVVIKAIGPNGKEQVQQYTIKIEE